MVSGACAALLVVLLWVTNAGSVRVARAPTHGLFHLSAPRVSRPVRSQTRTATQPAQPTTSDAHPAAWLGAVVHLIVILLVLIALVAAGLWLFRRFREWVQDAPPAPPKPFGVFEVVDTVLEDANVQLAALEGGTPRNAIVACWVRVEESAARAGLARRPAETSTQFTLRMLYGQATGATAISRLAVLYREARFSEHPMNEADRARAGELLAVVHESLRGVKARRDAERAAAQSAGHVTTGATEGT